MGQVCFIFRKSGERGKPGRLGRLWCRSLRAMDLCPLPSFEDAGTVLTLPISGVKVPPSCRCLGSLYSLCPSSSIKCWPPSSAWAGLMIPCASVSSGQPPAHLASLVLCGIPLLQVLLPSSWAPDTVSDLVLGVPLQLAAVRSP